MEINYSKYTLEELYQVLEHIDKREYPERVAIIKNHIENFHVTQSEIEKNQTQMSFHASKQIKIYSANVIRLSTFIGGPIIAGYMISENYKALSDEIKANHAISISLIITIITFVGLFELPENIVEKIPQIFIPATHTLLAFYFVKKKQSKRLDELKSEKFAVATYWQGALYGFYSLFITFLIMLVYIFLSSMF